MTNDGGYAISQYEWSFVIGHSSPFVIGHWSFVRAAAMECAMTQESLMPSDLILRRLTTRERDAVWAFARAQGLGGWSRPEFDRLAAQGVHSGLLAQRGKRLAGFLLYAV